MKRFNPLYLGLVSLAICLFTGCSRTSSTLNIMTTPDSASVFLNDSLKGTTPCFIANVKPGAYAVKIAKEGYRDTVLTAIIKKGIDDTLTLSLQKIIIPKKGKQSYQQITNPTDGSVLVEVPAGSFTMGSNDGGSDEKPVHTVRLDKYYIGKYEVTVGQFKKFCNAKGITMPKQPTWNNRDDHPVVNVTWDDAKAYCDWAGLRLPTEAEWEKAARGTDGRKYPWGNAWDASKCNSSENGDSYANTSPVGSFSSGVSQYGAYDMAGNVWEWCNDWYGSDYYGSSPSIKPAGPSSGLTRVLRGGGWLFSVVNCRAAFRFFYRPDGRLNRFGFRPAK